jgi:hypothetical protein
MSPLLAAMLSVGGWFAAAAGPSSVRLRPPGGYRKRFPGSNARTLRAARKRRNVLRNRSAHRG